MMSSTYAEIETTPGRWRAGWRRTGRRSLAGWQMALCALAACALAACGLSAIAVSREHWPDLWMGDDMRLNALLNVAAAAVIAGGAVAGLPLLILAGGAAALWAALQQASSVGWLPASLLPWAIALTAGAVLVSAKRLGRAYVALAIASLIAFGVALVTTRSLAALDFAVAAFAVTMACALLDVAWRVLRGVPVP